MNNDINRFIHRGWLISASFFVLFMLPTLIGQFAPARPGWITALAVGGIVIYGVGYIVLPVLAWRASMAWQLSCGIA